MPGHWQYPTRVGLAVIRLDPHSGLWRAILGDDDLGAYATPHAALDDLVGGHTFTHTSGVDTATLGLPSDLGDWHRVFR